MLPTSPAVDAIPAASCAATNGNAVTADQRGVARPQGKGCDIGAYELIQNVPFSSFQAGLAILTAKPYGYILTGVFTTGAGSAALNLATDAVTLQIAAYSVTIPAGSLKPLGTGANAPYLFEGPINGTNTSLVITPLGASRYGFAVGAQADFAGDANPVQVTLTVGGGSGTATVNAVRLH